MQFLNSLVIGSGDAFPKVLAGSAVLDFSSTATNATSDKTITVTGAALGDPVILGVPNGSVPTDGYFYAWVSAADTVTIRFWNNGGTSMNPASGTFNVLVLK